MKRNSENKKDLELSERLWRTGWTYIRNVVDTAREPFLILDHDLKVLGANTVFYRMFDVRARDTEHKFIFELGNGQWAGKHLRRLLEEILPNEAFFKDFEVDH